MAFATSTKVLVTGGYDYNLFAACFLDGHTSDRELFCEFGRSLQPAPKFTDSPSTSVQNEPFRLFVMPPWPLRFAPRYITLPCSVELVVSVVASPGG